jgi:4-amino-4-deoxy-L-arabinose transferase-like glycosyltransferase
VPYDSKPVDLFLFAEVAMPFKTWLYFTLEHLVLIMLSYVIAFEAKTYTTACKAFFWLQVVDLADYLLTYNTKWLGILSFNTVGMIIFAAFIIFEYVRVSD